MMSTARLILDIFPSLLVHAFDKLSGSTILINQEFEARKVYIEESLIGIFGISEDFKIIEKILYPLNAEYIANAILKNLNGEITKEVSETIQKLFRRGFNYFTFTNRKLANTIKKNLELQIEIKLCTPAGDFLRESIEKFAVEYGLFENASEFFEMSHKVSMILARNKIRKSQSGREVILIQAIQTLNEFDRSLNALSNKLREWYSLHFPELNRLIRDHELYAKIIVNFGDRKNINDSLLEKLEINESKAKNVIKSAWDSMGSSMLSEDINMTIKLASNLLSLYTFRRELEEQIMLISAEIAPNLSEIAGATLAARLIEKAGSLKRLAMMPSSTIQILGAEKALFRAKKTKSKPPKHGLIFQHPYVHSKNRRFRGRAARELASKLAIASRADKFSGNYLGKKLKMELYKKDNYQR